MMKRKKLEKKFEVDYSLYIVFLCVCGDVCNQRKGLLVREMFSWQASEVSETPYSGVKLRIRDIMLSREQSERGNYRWTIENLVYVVCMYMLYIYYAKSKYWTHGILFLWTLPLYILHFFPVNLNFALFNR